MSEQSAPKLTNSNDNNQVGQEMGTDTSVSNGSQATTGSNRGTIPVIIAGVAWGTISIFVKSLSAAGLDSLDIMCLRAWVSVAAMLVYFLIFDRKSLVIHPRDIWMFIGSGIVSLTFFSYCYFTTIVNLGAAVAVVLLYTSPIFVMIIGAVFFHERVTARKLVALVLTMAGCVLMAGIIGSGAGSGMSLGALLLGLGAGAGYALYSLFAGIAVRKYSSLTITFYTFVFSGLSLCLLRNPVTVVAKVEPGMIWAVLGTALINTVLPYLTYTYGMKHMDKSRAAVLVTVEPFVGTLLGLLVFHEDCSLGKIAGIVLLFTAIVLLALPENQKGQTAKVDR